MARLRPHYALTAPSLRPPCALPAPPLDVILNYFLVLPFQDDNLLPDIDMDAVLPVLGAGTDDSSLTWL